MTGIAYAEPLRAIGQALETLNLQSFEIEPVGNDFFVRAGPAQPNGELAVDGVNAATLNAVWGEVPESMHERAHIVLSPVELHYTSKDIERLEQEGQSRRSDANRMPDSSGLSQVLRCVGAYLNQKPAHLLKLCREAEAISIEYETSLGSKLKERLVTSELYDLWVRMYLQRAEPLSP